MGLEWEKSAIGRLTKTKDLWEGLMETFSWESLYPNNM